MSNDRLDVVVDDVDDHDHDGVGSLPRGRTEGGGVPTPTEPGTPADPRSALFASSSPDETEFGDRP